MPRVLLLAATTGYQTRAFGDAAERLGVDLVFATDRCHVLEDPWRDHAIPIRFHEEAGSVATILNATASRPIDGVIAVGDRPTVVASRVMEELGLLCHPTHAVAAARNKRLTRERFKAAGLFVPRFVEASLNDDASMFRTVGYPAVVKPLALSGSRGVMRVDSETELVAALFRMRALLSSSDIRAERHDAHRQVLVEQFMEGREFAVEGVMNHGTFRTLAVFDKPDPLNGPFFEETIYVTPSRQSSVTVAAITEAVTAAADALGLYHGPIHAECRATVRGVFVLEVAARPIGGLCGRSLQFVKKGSDSSPISLEELLLRHSLGESMNPWARESRASGVMMIPIPSRGVLRGVAGLEDARGVPGIEDIRVTAKLDQLLLPLPEGASYLGFIFARAATAASVDAALREAHARLAFTIVPEVRVLQSSHG